MRRKTHSSLSLAACMAAACVVGWNADRGEAACNQQPLVPMAHSSSLGGIDSPFLIPGREARISGLASFTNADAVTVAYSAPVLPPATPGPATTLVVVKSDCKNPPWNKDICASAGVAVTYCAESRLFVDPSSGGHALTFLVPMYAGEGPQSDAAKVDPKPDVFPTGPARLAVSPAGNIPCWLVDPSAACPTVESPALRACIDKITPPAGGAGSNETIDTVTALPFPNNFSELCDPAPNLKHPCKGQAEKLEFALDANGNILIPMDWSETTGPCDGSPGNCAPGQTCEKRDVLAGAKLASRAGSTTAIQIPPTDTLALQSFNESGKTFAPGPKFVVDPQTSASEFVLSGDIDKSFSVLRVLGCPGGKQTCDASDPTRYFNLGYRMEAGKGPIKELKRRCDDLVGTPCKNDSDCTTPGTACKLRVRGEAGNFHGGGCPSSPPVAGTGGEGGSTIYVVVVVVLGGLAFLWWRSS